MADQLVVYVNRTPDSFRWCWLDAQGQPRLETAGEGDAEALQAIRVDVIQQIWLVVPGTGVVTRELEYSDAEKKHLRRLLPYQLEESVIGDIDQFHFALGYTAEGRAALAYVEKAWLQDVFEQLDALGMEITHCWPAPLVLPLPASRTEGDYPLDYWTLQLQDGVLMVRYTPHQAFSIDQASGRAALEMLLTAQNRVDHLPRLQLFASSESELAELQALLPPDLSDQISYQSVVDFWHFDFASATTDLCQGEFSQRLPIERWWRDWRNVGMVAAASVLLYIGTLMFQINTLNRENLEVRRQIETVYRSVVPQGAMADPERQLERMVRDIQPAGQSGRVVDLLGNMLPVVAQSPGVTLRNIQYAAETGEININVTGTSFNAVDRLRAGIDQQGLAAELLSASAQGDVHSARMRISRRQP